VSLFLYSVTNAIKCGSLHTKRPSPIKEKPPQAPPKGGDVFPKSASIYLKEASAPPIYSLTPVPSPNGEGSENYYLQIKKSLTPNPSPSGEGSEHC